MIEISESRVSKWENVCPMGPIQINFHRDFGQKGKGRSDVEDLKQTTRRIVNLIRAWAKQRSRRWTSSDDSKYSCGETGAAHYREEKNGEPMICF